MRQRRLAAVAVLFTLGILIGCARTEVIESPKTAFVPDTAQAKRPEIVWTSRGLTQNFDYLGMIKSRSWSYEGALDRLVDAGQQLRADAIIDIHYERVGFLSAMQAFAIKYK